MIVMLKFILMAGLCVVSLLPAHTTEALRGDRSGYENRVEVRYRNAGERILSNAADKVLDKIFGSNKQERSFNAKVVSSINTISPYPYFSLGNLVLKLEQKEGYRTDTFVDNIDMFNQFSKGFSSYGIQCISNKDVDLKAEESGRQINVSSDDFENYNEGFRLEYYPVELTVFVRDFNPRTVSMEAEMFDKRQKSNVLQYRGSISVDNMTPQEKDRALLAIIKDFMDRYATIQ